MNNVKEKQAFKNFFYKMYLSYFPNKRDNLKQIIIKAVFLISLVTLVISAGYLTNCFLSARIQDKIIDEGRAIWHSDDSFSTESGDTAPLPSVNNLMLQENGDFKGWITISGTKIDNPIYQTVDNDFYLTHNQKKQKSAYGALFFDCNNTITEADTDKNLIVYGHHMKNGSMFANLTKYKSLNFYKEHPTIDFSTLYKSSTYKIYAAFVLNASKSDDDRYIYNISRKRFINEDDFNLWISEAFERSLINTQVDVNIDDNIITLVTCAYDFDDARFVVMARETREGEDNTVDTSSASANPTPKYPRRWYDEQKIDYPFD